MASNYKEPSSRTSRYVFVAILVVAFFLRRDVILRLDYKPPGLPLKISLNSKRELRFSSDHDISIPTLLGTFTAGTEIDPMNRYGTDRILIIRYDGKDHLYDLHGQDFEMEFEPGYYKQGEISKVGGIILLSLDRDPHQIIETVPVPTSTRSQPQANPTATTLKPTLVPTQATDHPIDFIEDYFELLNSGNYRQAWNQLSTSFKDANNETGYQGFADWWKSVKKVNVLTSSVVNYSGASATLDLELSYFYIDGRVDTYDLSRYWLALEDGRWLIDDEQLLAGTK